MTIQPAKYSPRQSMFAALGSDLLTLGVLATICLGLGLAINQLRDQPLPLIYASKDDRMAQAVSRLAPGGPNPAMAAQATPPASPVGIDDSPKVIGLAEFHAFVEAKRGVVLDARPEVFHRLGHVPGALSLPREEFEGAYAKQRVLLEPWREKEVAVYCSSESCEDSQMVADALAKLKFQRVMVFRGGWDEWTRAGLPQEHQ